jgi:hypothetical protein
VPHRTGQKLRPEIKSKMTNPLVAMKASIVIGILYELIGISNNEESTKHDG